jgi:uncharacterized protein YprB with RNaseH-like and TPR domain
VAALLLQSGGAVQTASSLPSPRTALTPPPPPSFATQTAAEASVRTTEPTTATRLRRVIDSTPRRSYAVPQGRALNDDSVAALLGGSVYDAGVVVVDRVVPQSERTIEPKNLAALVRRGTEVDESVGENLVYLDTETTGLAGGTGTVVFILGLARERNSVVEVRQFVLTGFVGEAALLAGAHVWLEDATGIVTYNGLSFDIPLLLTRFRMAELPSRHHQTLSTLPHLDLLHPMRAAFVRDWPNCTLQMAEQRLLHQHRIDDLPGSMVPAVFTDLVRYGRTARLQPAVDHNSDDLVSLAALVDILGGVYAGNGFGDAGGVARRLVRHGEHDRAHQILTTRELELSERDQALLATLQRRVTRLERRAATELERAQRLAAREAARAAREASRAVADSTSAAKPTTGRRSRTHVDVGS